MKELANLTYKEEVELLKDEENFEELGDKRYLHHEDVEARLYWAFCRPSGSSREQIMDPEPIVSIMAFNHSRLGALERFKLLHPDLLKSANLRKKISNRSRMLFRDLTDNDFRELNLVLDIAPEFLNMAVDQLINGRKWNDTPADLIEATKFIQRSHEYWSTDYWSALFAKLEQIEDYEADEIKKFLVTVKDKKQFIDRKILHYFQEETKKWLDECELHTLQKKSIERVARELG
ncbi:MAG TPA: hypothetical protein ENK87_04120 [Nitratifractor sp.]|jgi:hypothetical protein|nr:hypothetical protein [Nitratifractor sp.]HHD74330.1 hypothetical protein [Nitratifractor sp.]HHH21091.1 hypothetical protein [Nitratifractor sp.]